ncbi:L-threonine synthase [Halovenus aranensis]|uniref:L-threonine synthase n=1 Tax=Halovenus aranensis TaxID=890420 RepID=A0A1G8UPM3_9EURY|nr:pyridoxal-phosphate dependent enzyme [Halovenus aranensis]SDJ55669.1 L-threonine synthase [Halovenus aranensis]
MYRCVACDRRYEERAGPWRCECGRPLDFDRDPLPARGPPETLDRDRGLWAFDSFLPVDCHVSLGEGWTPLVDAPDWECAFKLEYCFPTGSFKDRGAATTLSHAVELGVDHVVEDSSGNAGAAIATYAARAGVDADIYVPADAKANKIRPIERAGATVRRIEGDRQAVTDACIEAVEAGDGWYASHAYQPAFFAGTATFAFELCAQREWKDTSGWSAPDVVVTPLGHGTLFLGAYRGFRALDAAGWIDDLPRLYGVQAAGVAPIATARGGDSAENANTAADGIQITEPPRRGQILDAIETTGGDAIAVDAEETNATLDRLHRDGFYTEPTCAVAPAGLELLRERGEVDAGESVAVALTGTGLKK